jgi:hypothetical protein
MFSSTRFFDLQRRGSGKRSVVVVVLGYYEHSRGAKIGLWCVCGGLYVQ